jgi:hypothetical protein
VSDFTRAEWESEQGIKRTYTQPDLNAAVEAARLEGWHAGLKDDVAMLYRTIASESDDKLAEDAISLKRAMLAALDKVIQEQSAAAVEAALMDAANIVPKKSIRSARKDDEDNYTLEEHIQNTILALLPTAGSALAKREAEVRLEEAEWWRQRRGADEECWQHLGELRAAIQPTAAEGGKP